MGTIAVTSCMYLGDLAPFIPIARRLHDRGHDVIFVAPEGFRSILEAEPFAFHPYALDASPSTLNADPRHTTLMRHPWRNLPRLGAYWMDRSLVDDAAACVESLRSGFDGADVVVTHPTMGVASIPVARSMGIRTVVGQLFPMMIPTRRWTPPLGPSSPDLGRALNSAAWSIMSFGTRVGMRDREVNAMRRTLGLDSLRANAARAWLETDRTVVLTSEHYYGHGADDWPAVTWGGFSIWQGPADQALSPELDRYVDDGDPPVVVTLGTSAATDAGGRFARIAGDLDRAGIRSVLLVGHENNLAPVAGHPAAVPFAPLTRLLPRCSVAVISGAAGGLAAALTAGIPVVVHPQLFDQVWHGRRVEELGVGRMVRKVGEVGAAVRGILDEPSFATRARALGALLTAEDGPGVVADVVEDLMSDSTP